MKTSNHNFQVVYLLRIIAANSVVIMHMPAITGIRFGVDMFFVLSGFFTMLITKNSTKNFLLKRSIKLLPAYYLFTLGVFLIALAKPDLLKNTSAEFIHLFKSLSFIPFEKNGTGHKPILFLGWTLNYMFYFYLLFFISFKISHKYRGEICALLIFTILIMFNSQENFPLKAYGDLIVVEFLLGFFIYFLIVDKNIRNCLVIFSLIVFASFWDKGFYHHRLMMAGLPSFMAILLCLLFLAKVRFPKSIEIASKSTYALYLTHPFVIQIFDKFTNLFDSNNANLLYVVLTNLLITNVVAVIIYFYLEKPINKFLNKNLVNN